jgi:adenylate cyclase
VFDSPLADASGVLSLQSEIAGDVAAQLGQPYGVIQEKLKVELTAARRLSLEDYLCVLDAYDYSRDKSEASHLRVRTCLEQVTQRSPNYSPAWAKLSWMYGDEERMAFNRRLNERPPFERAREAAGRAVEADAGSAMAHQYLAIALFHLGDDDAFRAEMEKALVLNPNNSEILADAGLTLTLLDVSERAREVSEKAILLNPGHPAWYYAAPAAYHLLRGEKEAAMQNALRYAPESSPASAYLLAAAYRLNGEAARADETLEELGRRTPSAISDRGALLKSLRFPPKLADLIFG